MAAAPTTGSVTALDDLLGGYMLYDPTYPGPVMDILSKYNLTRGRRHMATLEYESTEMSLANISMLGSARGLNIMGDSGDALKYAKMILELDALSEMTDPGSQFAHPGSGTRPPPGSLVVPMKKMIHEACAQLAKEEAAAAAAATAAAAAAAGGGGGGAGTAGYSEFVRAMDEVTKKRKEGKAKDLSAEEINKLRDAFKARFDWVPPRSHHGDGKAFGLVRYWMEAQKGYPAATGR